MVQERRAPTTEQVQAMIDASGGGGGTTSKSGSISCPSVTWTAVTFTTAFTDANYAINFGAAAPPVAADHKGIFYRNKVTTGFEIWQKEKAGSAIYIDWAATPYNDP